jgi:hypothetical protein
MADQNPEVTLNTLHEDLQGGFTDVKSAIADLKITLVAGFANMPTRESSEEMVRLLREGNRLHEERFAQLDLRIREQHFATQQVLRALAEDQRALSQEVRTMSGELRSLSADIKALIARLDALIKGRGDGGSTA